MWSNDFTNAPKDAQILVRHPLWECPAVVAWNLDSEEWLFCESALADIDGGIALDDAEGASFEWTAIPT